MLDYKKIDDFIEQTLNEIRNIDAMYDRAKKMAQEMSSQVSIDAKVEEKAQELLKDAQASVQNRASYTPSFEVEKTPSRSFSRRRNLIQFKLLIRRGYGCRFGKFSARF